MIEGVQVIPEESLIESAKRIAGVIILPDEEDVVTLSPSRMKTIKDCEAKYWFRYIQKLKIPPSAALTVGRGYDNATTTNYEHKLTSGKDLPESDIIDCFTTSFDEEIKEVELATDENEDELRDMGIKLVKKFRESLAKEVDPGQVQPKYRIKFPGVDWEMVVVLDVVEKNLTVRDNKTSKRTPSKVDPDYWFQMLCYSIAEKMQKGPEAGQVLKLDYAIKLKTPKIITLDCPTPDEEDFRFFQNYTKLMFHKMTNIHNGLYEVLPNRSSILCSRKYCGYWSHCEMKFGGKVDY